MWWLWIPIGIIGTILVLFLLLLVLGRFRNGALLKPVVFRLARIGFMQRFFQRISTAQMERSNPELASAMKKMQRSGALKDPMKAQSAMSMLSREERRALLDMQDQQGMGVAPEATNRQMRRQAERMQQQARGGPTRKRKRR